MSLYDDDDDVDVMPSTTGTTSTEPEPLVQNATSESYETETKVFIRGFHILK